MTKSHPDPSIKYKPKTEKKPKLTPIFEIEDDTVIFSFLWFDKVNQWGTGKQENLHNFWELAEKLKSIEQRSWRHIAGNQGRDHSVPFSHLINRAKELAVERKIDDFDEIWSFHFNGTQRLWGVKYNRRLMIVWWDPEHQICPSLKN